MKTLFPKFLPLREATSVAIDFEGWFGKMRLDKGFRDEYEAYRTSATAPESPKSWAHDRFSVLNSR